MIRWTRGMAPLVLLFCAAAADAQLEPGTAATVQLTVDGSSATGSVTAGDLQLDLTVRFEQVVGLTVENLGVSARVIDASELLGRLPEGASLPVGFPLLVTIEPPAAGGLSFSGLTTLELHTHDLTFVADSPLRLFTAPLGGRFRDITESMGMGSYRVRGSSGGFSEFLILADLRAVTGVAEQKLQRLEGLFAAHHASIAPEVAADLAGQLAGIRSAWDGGDPRSAAELTAAFADSVKAASGAAIPSVWRSARDLVNVAGELRAAARTLRFSFHLSAA